MSLKIRLARAGTKKRPVYHIVIADSRSPRDGRFIERLGYFNPLLPKEKTERLKLDLEKCQGLARQGRAADRPGRALPRRGRREDAREAQQPDPRDPAQGAQGDEGSRREGRRRGRRREGCGRSGRPAGRLIAAHLQEKWLRLSAGRRAKGTERVCVARIGAAHGDARRGEAVVVHRRPAGGCRITGRLKRRTRATIRDHGAAAGKGSSGGAPARRG